MNSKDPLDLRLEPNGAATTYAIPALGIQQGPFIFTYVSYFLSFITPNDLPIELLRDAIHSNVTMVELITEALKVEAGFLTIIGIFVTISLLPLGATVAWCCKRRSVYKQRATSGDTYRADTPPLVFQDDAVEPKLQCRKRASIFTIVLIFFTLILSDVSMFILNTQLSSYTHMAPKLVKASIHDIEVFLKDTHVQIKKSLDNGFDTAIRNMTNDLEDIDILLGEPIKSEISANTGIELAFDSLQGISAANLELINRILLLQESISKSMKISHEAAARMEELQIQLSVLQRQCTFRDRPLCDTLRIRSFEENGIIDALKTLQEDQSIFKMRYLGELEVGNVVKNLSVEVAISRSIFGNYPVQVKSDTLVQKNETIEQLDLIKSKTSTTSTILTHTIISLLDRLTGTWESIEPTYKIFESYSFKLWVNSWSIAMMSSTILVFIAAAFCCSGCCESNFKAGAILVAGVIVICALSFALMVFASILLIMGGNGEIFLCRGLFYEEDYATVEKMFDNPGLFYERPPESGILGEILRPPDVNSSIINVTLASVLANCEQNQPSYSVFHLDAFVNTTQMVDLSQYPKLNSAINEIQVSERAFLGLTQTLQSILENMLHTSSLNLTGYRTTISHPTPEKDLTTFIDQMQRVALQIQDVATSSRMSTLGSRAKRLQAAVLQPLEQLRNEIMYHLTALELQKDPWQKQVNQTLYHLKNTQGYLEKTAEEICSNQTKIYVQRLKGYLTSNKDKVSLTLGDQTAQCRPLFDIFDANRTFLCRYTIDTLNGIWFTIFWCLLLWSIGTPIALNIITIYDEIGSASGIRITNNHLYEYK